jgi:GDP-4-dehydro-6-deoxy-D-mannose reductase
MRVLLVGATGFAGSHFRHAAEKAGLDVIGAARHGAELTCDLLDPASLERTLGEARPDSVVNLAGAASVAASFRDSERTFEVNATGVLNLLEAVSRRAPEAHVLCVSSGDVYGAVEEARLPVTEDEPLAPVNPYGESKAAMESICGQYAGSADLEIAIARAFNHTGPGQSDSFAASSFARQIAEAEHGGAGDALLRTGDLSPERDFTDVRDIVEAYRLMAERRLVGTFNVCRGQPARIGELVEHLDAATPLAVRTEVSAERLRSVEVPVMFGSAARLREKTGWEPRIPLSTTMRDLLEWWRAASSAGTRT